MKSKLLKIKKQWKIANISNATLAIARDISIFESQNNLKLPSDLIEYFLLLNGTSKEYDDRFFCFYSINEFEKIENKFGEWMGPPDYRSLLNNKNFWEDVFVFSDYQFHLFSYAIRLSKDVESNEIYILCGNKYKSIARSFNEFVDLYLQDSSLLYFN